MAPPLLTHHCWNHGERVAVARCLGCGRHFCRECVAEHEGRMTCAACLRRAEEVRQRGRPWWRTIVRGGQTVLAGFVVWWVFLLFGELLARLPESFHEGTVWEDPRWRTEESP